MRRAEPWELQQGFGFYSKGMGGHQHQAGEWQTSSQKQPEVWEEFRL